LAKIEQLFFANNNGTVVLDEDKGQGNFIFYYAPSKKIVIYDVYLDKKNTLQMAFNRRKNTNANIQPSIIEEVTAVMLKIAGVKDESVEVEIPAPESARVDIAKALKDVGGI